MVQPAHKRRAIEDSPNTEFEELEDLKIAQADKKLIVLETSNVDRGNDSQLEQSKSTMPAESTVGVNTPEDTNGLDQMVSSPPRFFESILEAPQTPQRQTSSQKTSTPRSQYQQKTLNDYSVRNDTRVSPTPEEEIKPRMVMTRMVLNNFKSYAGRQDIGPFHKVRHQYHEIYHVQATDSDIFSHLVQLLDPTDPENRMSSTPFCSFSDTELTKCAKANWPN